MIISFDIPNPKLTRLGNVLHRFGYVFDPNAGTTDLEQKEAFLKTLTITYWRNLLAKGEYDEALDTTVAGLPDPDLSDVS